MSATRSRSSPLKRKKPPSRRSNWSRWIMRYCRRCWTSIPQKTTRCWSTRKRDWKALCEVGADNKRNLVASDCIEEGDPDAVYAACAYKVDETYHTKANQQAMMETFRTWCQKDVYGRLMVVSSTQIVFHLRRILAGALDIPKSKIRVLKPRIGGGFRRQADQRLGNLPGVCHLEDRQAVQAGVYPVRIADRLLPPGMKWNCGCGRVPMKTVS